MGAEKLYAFYGKKLSDVLVLKESRINSLYYTIYMYVYVKCLKYFTKTYT